MKLKILILVLFFLTSDRLFSQVFRGGLSGGGNLSEIFGKISNNNNYWGAKIISVLMPEQLLTGN